MSIFQSVSFKRSAIPDRYLLTVFNQSSAQLYDIQHGIKPYSFSYFIDKPCELSMIKRVYSFLKCLLFLSWQNGYANFLFFRKVDDHGCCAKSESFSSPRNLTANPTIEYLNKNAVGSNVRLVGKSASLFLHHGRREKKWRLLHFPFSLNVGTLSNMV